MSTCEQPLSEWGDGWGLNRVRASGWGMGRAKGLHVTRTLRMETSCEAGMTTAASFTCLTSA